ncbi:MAG: hypothetical protein WD342_10430 [Verrucomicrobiales bacterium]
MIPIHYWRYTLRSTSALNARSARTEHEGALIRAEDGFGCIHPWPELGDAPLDEQLARLARGDRTPVLAQALCCARIDGEARREASSLFVSGSGDPIPMPPSHLLAQPRDEPGEAWEAGFRVVKHKVGPDLSGLVEKLDPWVGAEFRIRLDANETVSVGEWRGWWNRIPAALRSAIDFVEDPCPWSGQDWQSLRDLGLPVAADRDAEARGIAADVLVYKPAIDGEGKGGSERELAGKAEKAGGVSGDVARSPALLPWEERCVEGGKRLVVTSVMDHALGQLWAAHRAAVLGLAAPHLLTDCGLLTHRCFEPDPFFDRIRTQGPRLLPPPGTGLGFDDLLDKLPWKRLN